MQINPGVADKAEWARVAFKGGSEAGVMSLATDLLEEDGTHYCASVVLNGPEALDEVAIMSAYRGVLSLLAEE
jgi:hypothetical protein